MTIFQWYPTHFHCSKFLKDFQDVLNKSLEGRGHCFLVIRNMSSLNWSPNHLKDGWVVGAQSRGRGGVSATGRNRSGCKGNINPGALTVHTVKIQGWQRNIQVTKKIQNIISRPFPSTCNKLVASSRTVWLSELSQVPSSVPCIFISMAHLTTVYFSLQRTNTTRERVLSRSLNVIFLGVVTLGYQLPFNTSNLSPILL